MTHAGRGTTAYIVIKALRRPSGSAVSIHDVPAVAGPFDSVEEAADAQYDLERPTTVVAVEDGQRRFLTGVEVGVANVTYTERALADFRAKEAA